MPAAAAGDNEFYFARLAKCRAVRESKRTADSRAFIECHEGMEAALVALSPNRATRARDGSVVFPAHEAAVALARSLRGFVLSESACLRVCPHLEHMVVLLALIPLVTPATFPTTNWRIDLKLLRPPFPAAGSPAARVALGHLLKGVGALAWAPDELIDPAREALTAACMVLLNAQGSAIGAELAGLAADAGGSGPRLATVADLKIACLSHMTGPRNPNDDERLVAAELLLPLDPDDPGERLAQLAVTSSNLSHARTHPHPPCKPACPAHSLAPPPTTTHSDPGMGGGRGALLRAHGRVA